MKLTEDVRLIIKICKLYYENDLSQKEIAKQLNISTPQISRALAFARQSGYVSVQINNPFAVESQYEERLVETYGLRDALVINVPEGEGIEIGDVLAQASRNRMDQYLARSSTVGLMSGRTIAWVTDAVTAQHKSNTLFVPLVGGMGVAGADWHANNIARKLAVKTGGTSYILNAPLVVRNPEARELLETEPEIDSVLSLANKCDFMLLGVGEIADTATLVESGSLTEAEIDGLKKEGAVAAVACGFIDDSGESLESDLTRRFIGARIREVRNCPHVVVAAFGRKKVEAIDATLKSGIAHEVITTAATARELLEID